jgi:hypothetical protein
MAKMLAHLVHKDLPLPLVFGISFHDFPFANSTTDALDTNDTPGSTASPKFTAKYIRGAEHTWHSQME